jgi:hypothetical protein
MPRSAPRRRPKHPALPIDLEEMEHDPGFRGMLSFLEVSPADRAALLTKRDVAESHVRPPTGASPVAKLLRDVAKVGVELPAGERPADLVKPANLLPGTDHEPMGELAEIPLPERPLGELPVDVETPDLFPGTGWEPRGHLRAGAIPYMEVEGRGKRPLRYCQTAQDGHTASEQLAYQTLWTHAQKHGRSDASGSYVVDVGLSQLCSLLATDHKNVKRLIGSLREKLAVEIVRQPDYRLAIPTRYRVFNPTEILTRRRNAGLVWVIRTRAVRFVDLDTVQRVLSDVPVGRSPVDETTGVFYAFPASLAENLKQWIPIDDDAVMQLWEACRRELADCTEEEVHWFCRSKEALIRSGKIDDPVALLIRSVPQFFVNGGAGALLDQRKEQARAQERERKRQRQAALMVLGDPESTEAEMNWAKEILAAS